MPVYTRREFRDLRAKNAQLALKDVYNPKFVREDRAVNFLPVVVKGGIGDLVVALPIIQEIKQRVGAVQVYSNYPEVHRILGDQRDIAPEKFTGYDFWLSVETAPRFIKGDTFRGGRSLALSPIGSLWAEWLDYCWDHPEIERFMHYQPNFDYELALEAVSNGLTRASLPRAMLGVESPPILGWANVKPDPTLDLGEFITVHDGFDVTQKDIPYRSTKSWSLRKWASVVRALTLFNPSSMIVQIGGPNSRPIPGVDINFSGKLSIEQSLKILRSSLCHIDGDSGLVHAAHAMGVRSVVIFGSTPAKFFGYPENINLEPKECGGCWWTTRSWMAKCPVYEDGPKCADSVDSESVVKSVFSILSEGKITPAPSGG